jgi:hypothetical protein
MEHNEQDPWTEDKEPPVQAVSGVAEAALASLYEESPQAADIAARMRQAHLAPGQRLDERKLPLLPAIFGVGPDMRRYAESMTPKSLTEAEQMLLAAQYDFEIASEDADAAAAAYSDAESQQARTKVRVIEKLMSNADDSQSRVQNAKKKDEGALSFSTADRIASGHPEYTKIRDDVAEKLNLKTKAERRVAIAEQRVLTLREIVQNRRRFGFVSYFERELHESGAGSKASSAPVPRSVDLREDERVLAEKKDSRALHGIERIDNERPRFRTPGLLGQVIEDHAEGHL